MNESKEKKLPLPMKPRGFLGKFLARYLMPIGHRDIYRNVAPVLNLCPEDVYLELGFGSGIFIKRYASHVRSVAGLDFSEDMVELASDVNRKCVKKGRAEFRHGEASELPWKDERFTVVTSMGSFIGFPKPLQTLKEIHRVLRPGGRAVISLEWNGEDGRDHSKWVKQYGMRVFTEEEIQRMLQEAGFSKISITYSKGLGMPKMMIAHAVK